MQSDVSAESLEVRTKGAASGKMVSRIKLEIGLQSNVRGAKQHFQRAVLA